MKLNYDICQKCGRSQKLYKDFYSNRINIVCEKYENDFNEYYFFETGHNFYYFIKKFGLKQRGKEIKDVTRESLEWIKIDDKYMPKFQKYCKYYFEHLILSNKNES